MNNENTNLIETRNKCGLKEGHKKILLEFFENGQQLIDSWTPPENPCCKCGEDSTIMFEFRREMSFRRFDLKDDDWEEVEHEYIDDGDYDHTEMWCKKCFEKE